MADFNLNVTGTIANDAVTNAKLANMVSGSVKGRQSGGSAGDPEDLTPDQVSAILDFATDPFVRTSDLPSGGGDVVGPAGATANNVPLWDGNTGKLLKDGLGTSTGGNGLTDVGKVVLFGAGGSLNALADGVASNNAISGTIAGGVGTVGVLGYADTGVGVTAVTESDSAPALNVVNQDPTNTGDIAHFHNTDGEGFEVRNDGEIDWTSATGAQNTVNNLPVFGALTKGVVPAAGAVPSASKYLDETGAWDEVEPGDLSGLGTGVATALGQNANSASGFVTQTGGDARYDLLSNWIITVLNSTQTTSSTSLIDCTGLSVTLAANTLYQIEGFILYQSNNVNNGISLSMNGPASPTMFCGNYALARGFVVNVNINLTAYNETTNSNSVETANTTYFTTFNGAIRTGASGGSLIVRFASENGGNTVSVMQYSTLRARKVQ